MLPMHKTIIQEKFEESFGVVQQKVDTMVSILCPFSNCYAVFRRPFAKVGTEVECPYCHNRFVVTQELIFKKGSSDE